MTVRTQPSTTQFFSDVLDAEVHLTRRQDSRCIRVRWKAGRVHVSAPFSLPVETVLKFLDSSSERIRGMRPRTVYSRDTVISFPEGRIAFACHADDSHAVCSCRYDPESNLYNINISLPAGADMGLPAVSDTITSLIADRLRRIAPLVLIEQAKAIAEELGCHPAAWAVSSGRRVLGSCDRKGIIRLSYMLMLLPFSLRRYIVCHELAHLSEMNHSERFHAIADVYCGGCEKQLARELKAFRWPVPR